MDYGKLTSLMAEFPWLGEALRLISDKDLGARDADGYVCPLHELIQGVEVLRTDGKVLRFMPSRIVYENGRQHLSFVAVFGGSEVDRRFQLLRESKVDWVNWGGMIVEASCVGAQLGMERPLFILEVLYLEDSGQRTVNLHKMAKFDWDEWKRRTS